VGFVAQSRRTRKQPFHGVLFPRMHESVATGQRGNQNLVCCRGSGVVCMRRLEAIIICPGRVAESALAGWGPRAG